MTEDEERGLITAAYFADLRAIKKILKKENQKNLAVASRAPRVVFMAIHLVG